MDRINSLKEKLTLSLKIEKKIKLNQRKYDLFLLYE